MFAAFGDLASVIQGGRTDEDEEEGEEIEVAEDEEQQEEEAEGSEKAAGEKLSLWGMASALRETVKKRTAELAASIQETDWRAELDALKEELVEVKEDTVELGQELGQKTRAAVAQLPGVMEQWKGEGGLGAKAEGAGTALQAKAKEAQEQVLQASKKLGLFGTRVLHGTSELFDQIKDAIQAEMAFDEPPSSQRHMPSRRQLAAGASVKFSRFEADVSAMQRDSSTYCDEPEDEEDYAAWLASFDLTARRSDIDALVASNTFMAELQARIVPLIVEYDAFWTRYFYRLHKLQQKHEQFVQLTQRANNNTEEEDLGWGSDEEEQQAGESNPASPAQQQQEEEGEEKVEEAAVGEVEEGEEAASQADAAAFLNEPKEAAPAAEAPSSSVAAATIASSPASPQSETVSIHSDTSQVSGGTQESWQVVSSPRAAADQKASKSDAAAALTTAGEAAAKPDADKKEGSGSAAGAAAGADKGAEKGSSSKVAAGAAAGSAAAAAAATPAAPAKPAAKEDKPAAASTSKKEKDGEESELSDFDVDDNDAPAAGEVDEDWGDDWE